MNNYLIRHTRSAKALLKLNITDSNNSSCGVSAIELKEILEMTTFCLSEISENDQVLKIATEMLQFVHVHIIWPIVRVNIEF